MSDSKSGSKEPRQRRSWALIGVAVTAAVVAIATVLGTGVASAVIGLFEGDDPLVTSSDVLEVYECGTPLFVRQPEADGLLDRGSSDWMSSLDGPAVPTSPAVVEVSIQGESTRTVTLTKIRFEVTRKHRPDGASFANPCGDGTYGRSLDVDLDQKPPVIVQSVADEEGIRGALDHNGQAEFKPIRFPWTVSLTDPLTLKIVAITERCYCNWRAFVAWSSGGKSGELSIDNRGRGYDVAGHAGLPRYVASGDGWNSLPPES